MIRVLTIILVLLSTSAKADCFCACIDGQNQAVCAGSLNIPPICQPAICR